MKLVNALVMALLLAAPAVAADPVNVTADTLTVDDKTKNAVFSGNVVITRADMTMWADKVVVVYGAGGQGDIESLTATGKVRLKTPEHQATGRQATYDPRTMVLRLSDNVVVTNSTGTMSGPELVLDLANNTSTFRGSDSGRVTGVFTPQ
jgi:lipopolysaccharide export system protein LptA